MHYFPYDVKLGLLAHSQSFLANQKARNAIVRAENLLIIKYPIAWDAVLCLQIGLSSEKLRNLYMHNKLDLT